jgi:hypothetical protein
MSYVEPKFADASGFEGPNTREITSARSSVTFWSNRAADPSRTRQDRADANAKCNAARVRLWNAEHAPTTPDDPDYAHDPQETTDA